MSTNRNKKGRLYLSNISFSSTSVNLEFSLKFSILTYKTLNDQAPLYLKKDIEHFSVRQRACGS